MYIYNPVADFISEMVASRQMYRCQVDGCDEFGGEKLPVGTKEEVLSWIKSHFKLVDEILIIQSQMMRQHIINFCCNPFALDVDSWLPVPSVVRYLVDIDGVEKLFVLKPMPDGVLEYRQPKQLIMGV